jgi:hypothetical protein
VCPVDSGVDDSNVDALPFITFAEIVEWRQLLDLAIDRGGIDIVNTLFEVDFKARVASTLLTCGMPVMMLTAAGCTLSAMPFKTIV